MSVAAVVIDDRRHVPVVSARTGRDVIAHRLAAASAVPGQHGSAHRSAAASVRRAIASVPAVHARAIALMLARASNVPAAVCAAGWDGVGKVPRAAPTTAPGAMVLARVAATIVRKAPALMGVDRARRVSILVDQVRRAPTDVDRAHHVPVPISAAHGSAADHAPRAPTCHAVAQAGRVARRGAGVTRSAAQAPVGRRAPMGSAAHGPADGPHSRHAAQRPPPATGQVVPHARAATTTSSILSSQHLVLARCLRLLHLGNYFTLHNVYPPKGESYAPTTNLLTVLCLDLRCAAPCWHAVDVSHRYVCLFMCSTSRTT